MLIADAQAHIWAADTPERPWPKGRQTPHRPEPVSKDDLLREMDAAGVQRAIIVPPSWEGERNDLGLAAARAHPNRLAIMGRLDTDAADAREQLATWCQQPGMLGLRFTFLRSTFEGLLEGTRIDWLWAGAEAAAVPIMISVSAPQLQIIDKVAERHPGLRLGIDHLAIPRDAKDEEAFTDLDALLALAKRPNVAVKATTLPRFTTDSYPYRRLHPYLRRVYDAFGPRRIFWGADLTRLPCTYRQAVTMFTEGIPWLTSEDKEWIMGRGLCEWVGWKR